MISETQTSLEREIADMEQTLQAKRAELAASKAAHTPTETMVEQVAVTYQRLQAMFTESAYGSDPGVCCPFCGYDCVHFTDVEAAAAPRSYGMNAKGEVTALTFEGECGHRWMLLFAFHKGATYTQVARLPDDESASAFAADDNDD